MTPLEISAIVGLIVALILAIVVWTIVAIEFRKILKQRKIDRLIKRIRERAEDSGNESEGDTDELAKLVEMGDFDPWVGDNL
uniref:Protein Vpu n=1 Tax=Human immunodeficiency virus type 1 TaxID=11676 RepID=A0A221IZC3_HV1|nr:vpu protein [Human immunodeficiency virus 1]QSQ63869.1 vpu protein [Simian-Human immunodeficiency virus]ASM59327.1 vpu protein [Human immunodeficiency virus 1]ASM59335.1 vpu protein [Human immunodeficiency virus 1]ASM59344.1 vpu protein [Human immunodeficiency virus 1]